MPDLVVRPSGHLEKPWSLQLRYHESLGETEYRTLWRGSLDTAKEIVEAGECFFLFGEPNV